MCVYVFCLFLIRFFILNYMSCLNNLGCQSLFTLYAKIFSHSFFKYKFIYFNWRWITLQCCIGFAIHQHELPQVYTCSPSWTPPPSSLPVPSLWVIPVHQPQATSIMHQTWTGDSFHIWYYTCFNSCSFLLRLFLDCSQLFGSNMLQTMYFAHSSFLLIAELSE